MLINEVAEAAIITVIKRILPQNALKLARVKGAGDLG